MSLTYRDSGVDIFKGDRVVEFVRRLCAPLMNNRVLGSIGGFSAKYRLADGVVITATTDGVGTKLKVAFMAGVHDTVGIDLVAMNVNDIAVDGGDPLFFLDYIAYSEVEDSVIIDVVRGIVEGLKVARCPLVGGETAQMPGFYSDGEYDISGFCVGTIDEREMLPRRVEAGDVLLGVSSNGFHSNGYSLLRKVFFEVGGFDIDSEVEGITVGELLLRPTSIYVELMKRVRGVVKAASHITGGGFYSNIPRVMPDDVVAVVEKSSYEVPWEFKLVQKMGGMSEEEMYKTFNMGVGLVLFLEEREVERVELQIRECGFIPYRLGIVERGNRGVKLV